MQTEASSPGGDRTARDKVIIISCADYDDAELGRYEPRIVHVDTANRVVAEGEARTLAASDAPPPRRYVEVSG